MTLFATRDGTKLFEQIWTPAASSIGTIVLLHGYGEHIGRYAATAAALNAAGWRVHGYDHRGHGESTGLRGHCMHFSEYLEDLHEVIERARTSSEGRGPLFVLSHSFGSLVALRYLIDRQSGIAGLVCSSPFLKLAVAPPIWKEKVGRLMSRLYPSLAIPSDLKGENVSHDPEIIAKYNRDPLCHKVARARWFTETSRAQDEVYERAQTIKLPTLFLLAGADKVVDARRGRDVFAKLGSSDKTLHVYEGQYHEVFNELPADRERTWAELVKWLGAHSARTSEVLQTERA